ncbi:MAG: ABC transporter ATP-binding protein [Planctomycetaceae bacterium]|nr:ABC transporter ATP-binding protein [Planctomycetaceae bacterium]
MLRLAWQFRAGSLKVLVQQVLLVLASLAVLGLTGLGIDYIRHRVDTASPPPTFPLDWQPPVSWSPLAVVALIAAGIQAVAIVNMVLRYRAAITVARLTQQIVVQLRTDVYDKLQRLSFRFYDRHESGSIINRVTADVQAVRMFVDGVIIQVLVTLISLGVYLVYMCRLHVGLTLACLATTPLLWILTARCSRVLRPMYKRNRELADRMIRTLSENVQGAQVVKGFGREPEEIEKFHTATRNVREGKQAVFHRLSVFQPVMGGLTQLNMLVLIGYGGWLVTQDRLPLGEGLFVFANLLHQFANQIGNLANISNSIQASITGAQRVFEVLDAQVDVDSPAKPVPMPKIAGRITFEHVTFGYQPEHLALEDVTFDIAPGECVAIVGATGAGKSTLLSLVPRFYDPDQGRVLIDGVDARQLDLFELRRQIGIVFQESFLFSHTVAANIAFGAPDATDEQITSAAQIAAAHEFVAALSEGYETVIGEYGSNLSGGQRQRLAIARAVLLEPPILLLDDATTAIDPETEHEIMIAMERAMRGRTTLVVAHRLSTLRQADRVVVLERGRVVQIGTHAELMQQPGHYRDNALLQMHDDESPEPVATKLAVSEDSAEMRGVA